MKTSSIFVSLFGLFLGLHSFAADQLVPAPAVPNNTIGYYEVSETPNASSQQISFAQLAAEELRSSMIQLQAAAQAVLDLLKWKYFNQAMPVATDPYNRAKHFGTWIVDRSEDPQNCHNTRARALIRDSEIPVSYSPKGQCTVENGQWHDPYSGADFTVGKDVQIDHVVALKNAYTSGAFEWPQMRRCLYANFLGNNFHLLSVSGKENLRKLDYGPEKWMPLDPGYRCQHLKNWLTIKMIWNLWMTNEETAAIEKEFQVNHCETQKFQVAVADLVAQRGFIESHIKLCELAASQNPFPTPVPTANPTPSNF